MNYGEALLAAADDPFELLFNSINLEGYEAKMEK